MTERALQQICEKLGYEFQDVELLRQALRHPSFTHEHPNMGDHNQRLEFLGDAVVGLVVAEALFQRYPEAREGELTRWRAALVSSKPLAQVAKALSLGDQMSLGRGEDAGGGRQRRSLLADVFEAVVGAAFLDGGLDAARVVVRTALSERLEQIGLAPPIDHKSMLQEKVQSNGHDAPVYQVVSATGPDHDKRFEVHIQFNSQVLGTGVGSSKKTAEQAAARDALDHIDEEVS